MSPTREQFAAVVRETPVDVVTALVLLAAEAGITPDIVEVLTRLDALAEQARRQLDVTATPAEAIQVALGQVAGFRGSDTDYGRVGASLLPEVLQERSGLPILLSVVWVEVARRLDVPARCLALPGHVLAEVGGKVVDPFAGGAPVVAATLPAEIPTLEGGPLLLRVLANLRALGARTGDHVLGLWAAELSLLLPSHPLELRRERGAMLVRNGRFSEGAQELEAYAEIAPSPHDDEARRAATMARAQLN